MIVFTHPDCLRHDPGPGHPEWPARLSVVLQRLAAAGIPVHTAAPAPREVLLAVHPAAYLDHLERIAAAGGGVLDEDTTMNGASWSAALGGAGAALAAVMSALAGTPAFAAVRPPGHHALAGRAMGFCLLGNVVISRWPGLPPEWPGAASDSAVMAPGFSLALCKSAANFISCQISSALLQAAPSLPKPTGMPKRRIWATGAMPEPSFKLAVGQ